MSEESTEAQGEIQADPTPEEHAPEKIVGVGGNLISVPRRRWKALVGKDGKPVLKDGHRVRVRDW